MMIAVLTGDIVDSRKRDPKLWMPVLKTVLEHYGKVIRDWEIYRGDSFQLRITAFETSLKTALHIKAAIKTIDGLDVRIAIGIGEETYSSKRIAEANGSAFERSGNELGLMKKNRLAFSGADETLNATINLMFELASLTMNNWTTTSSEIIAKVFENPDATQTQLSELLHKTQGNISAALSRAGFDSIKKIDAFYRKALLNITTSRNYPFKNFSISSTMVAEPTKTGQR